MVKNEIFEIIGSRQYQQQLGTMVILFVKEAQRSEAERHLVHLVRLAHLVQHLVHLFHLVHLLHLVHLVHFVHLVEHLVQRWKGILCITLVSLHWLPR